MDNDRAFVRLATFAYLIIDLSELTRPYKDGSDRWWPRTEDLAADVVGLTGGEKAPFPHDLGADWWD